MKLFSAGTATELSVLMGLPFRGQKPLSSSSRAEGRESSPQSDTPTLCVRLWVGIKPLSFWLPLSPWNLHPTNELGQGQPAPLYKQAGTRVPIFLAYVTCGRAATVPVGTD